MNELQLNRLVKLWKNQWIFVFVKLGEQGVV